MLRADPMSPGACRGALPSRTTRPVIGRIRSSEHNSAYLAFHAGGFRMFHARPARSVGAAGDRPAAGPPGRSVRLYWRDRRALYHAIGHPGASPRAEIPARK
jgi:hypothetical protein